MLQTGVIFNEILIFGTQKEGFRVILSNTILQFSFNVSKNISTDYWKMFLAFNTSIFVLMIGLIADSSILLNYKI